MFERFAQLQQQMREKHAFKCPQCPAICVDKEGLKAHQQLCHDLSCDKCLRTFGAPLALVKNYKDYHGVKCSDCDGAFDDEAALTAHKKFCHSLPRSKCSSTFGTALAFSTHYQKEHAKKCTICGGAFDDEKALQEHITASHVPVQAVTSQHKSANATIVAPSHSHPASDTQVKVVNGPAQEQRQLQNSIPGGAIISNNVPMPPKTPAENHQAVQNLTKSTYYCKPCREVFVDEAQLQLHLEVSPFHEPPTVDCSECCVSFTNQIELLRHFESKPHQLVRWKLFVV
jgi:hypothetical protein